MLYAAAAATLLAAALAAGEVAVPRLAARVTDETATLDAGQRAALEARLAAFEAKKGSQIAVLLVPSTAPEAIEQYSIRVVDAWKLGRKGVDDGALLLVAKNDRKVRIEVGRGLEGALPDAIAKRIVVEHITPRFKEGDFYGGINAGVERIIKVIEGEALPPPPAAQQPAGRFGFDWIELLIIGLVVGSVVNAVLRPIASRLGAATLTGGGVGFLIWMLAGTIAAALVGGIAMFLFALFSGSAGRRGWSSGGWRSGGWGGGGWSSGGGGGGGFSGGGGGFSGGGASGSW